MRWTDFKEGAVLDLRRLMLTKHQREQCAVCLSWVDIDDIVWRGPYQNTPICTKCEAEGDDCR